ncbi:MAG: glycosyltransferase family 4 protein [Planctomycetes bacterium]|nr:glycosyltransferase family 4 protein [Planctomycetota bacterium]
MRAYGIVIEPGMEFSNRSLGENADSIDAIHFNWLEHLWAGSSLFKRIRAVVGVRNYCRFAKRLGKRIIWTVHNHAEHEGGKWGDRFGFRSVARAADLIIVHSRWSEEYIQGTYHPSGEIVHMPHGNFDGFYAQGRSSAKVRGRLGLTGSVPICGLVGGVRPYRGHELAMEAVKKLGGRVRLLIAGPCLDESYRARICELIGSCPEILFVPRRLNDAEYAEMVQACDVILLPYQNITGSGALLAAWTLGLSVIMSDLPYFRELRPTDSAAGLILESRTAPCLANAIEQLLALPTEVRNRAARAEADRYRWDELVTPVARVLGQWNKKPLPAVVS